MKITRSTFYGYKPIKIQVFHKEKSLIIYCEKCCNLDIELQCVITPFSLKFGTIIQVIWVQLHLIRGLV